MQLALPLRVSEIRPPLGTLGRRESSACSARFSSTSSRPKCLAATGHRKLLAVVRSAAPGMRSGILPAQPRSTPHGAEVTTEVANGFRERLECLAGPRTFSAMPRSRGADRDEWWNAVQPDSKSCMTGQWASACALSERRSPHSLACIGAATASTESTSVAGHGETQSIPGHEGSQG